MAAKKKKRETPLPLARRYALVTGGGIRLGRAIALALADAGAEVAVHYNRSAKPAAETVRMIEKRGGQAFAIQGDLTDEKQVEKVFRAADRRFGAILHVLVNSAGVMEKAAHPGEIDAERFLRMMRTNALSALLCARAASPRMLSAGGGSIVNITDISADRPWRGYLEYCASKAALVSITKSLALEMAPLVRVNAVSPGAVLVPEAMGGSERARLIENIPQKRLGTPEDVAAMVASLAAGPSYLTGQVIAVDGGRSISTR